MKAPPKSLHYKRNQILPVAPRQRAVTTRVVSGGRRSHLTSGRNRGDDSR